jgi:hypothetical protein
VALSRLLTIEGGETRLSLKTRVVSVKSVNTSTIYDVAPVTNPQLIDAPEVLGVDVRFPGATGTATGVLNVAFVQTPDPAEFAAWTLQA